MVAKLDHSMSPRLWKSQMLHRSSCSLSWTQGSMRRALCTPFLKLKFTWIQEVFFLCDVKPNNSCHFVWNILSKKSFEVLFCKWIPFSGMIFIAIDIVMNARGAGERYKFSRKLFLKYWSKNMLKPHLCSCPSPAPGFSHKEQLLSPTCVPLEI